MTPLRIMLTILAAGAGIVAAYALFIDASPTKLPLLVASLSVFGIAIAVLGFVLAGAAVRCAQDGFTGRSVVLAFVGGLFVLAAAGSVAMAIILGILAGGVA